MVITFLAATCRMQAR